MKVHFIAIGGSAMHNLAIALKLKGCSVSGSDDEIFEPARSRLKKYSLLPEQISWHPEKLDIKSTPHKVSRIVPIRIKIK